MNFPHLPPGTIAQPTRLIVNGGRWMRVMIDALEPVIAFTSDGRFIKMPPRVMVASGTEIIYQPDLK